MKKSVCLSAEQVIDWFDRAPKGASIVYYRGVLAKPGRTPAIPSGGNVALALACIGEADLTQIRHDKFQYDYVIRKRVRVDPTPPRWFSNNSNATKDPHDVVHARRVCTRVREAIADAA
jgi:hypothetical protein